MFLTKNSQKHAMVYRCFDSLFETFVAKKLVRIIQLMRYVCSL